MNTVQNRYSRFKQEFVKFGLLTFPLILPLPLPLNIKSIAFIIFLVVLFLMSYKNQSINQIIKNKIVVLFLLLYLLDPILSFIREGGMFFRDIRISFFVAPFIFLIGKEVLVSYKNKILNAFLIGVLLYVLYFIIYIIYFYSQPKTHDFVLGYYLKYVAYHYLPNSIHHTYMGIYVCFALTIILFNESLNKIIKVLFCCILFFSIFFIASKLSIIFSSFILSFFLFRNLKLSRSKRIVILSSFTITILFIIYYLFYNTDLFRTLENSIGKRFNLYSCSFKGIKSNYLIGIGNKNIKTYINTCNSEIGLMDTHNIFFQEFLSNGLIGIVILIFIIYILFKLFIDSKSNLGIILISSLLIFGSIEHLLNLQHGTLFYMFFLLFFYSIFSGLNHKNLIYNG